jgi:hypothetical protein
MKRAAVIAFALFAATASSAQIAQQRSYGTTSIENLQQQSSTTLVVEIPAACSVNMRALQGSGTGLLAVRGQQTTNGMAQRIHLVLANGKSAQVMSARVRVRGLSGKNRIAHAASSTDITPDLSRTLQAAFTPESGTAVSADLFLPGFTSVSSVELESITYKDRSTWNVPGPQFCHVAPDAMMLIAGH